jgi:hypothetical protein
MKCACTSCGTKAGVLPKNHTCKPHARAVLCKPRAHAVRRTGTGLA